MSGAFLAQGQDKKGGIPVPPFPPACEDRPHIAPGIGKSRAIVSPISLPDREARLHDALIIGPFFGRTVRVYDSSV
jgi:hypothetical protein